MVNFENLDNKIQENDFYYFQIDTIFRKLPGTSTFIGSIGQT